MKKYISQLFCCNAITNIYIYAYVRLKNSYEADLDKLLYNRCTHNKQALYVFFKMLHRWEGGRCGVTVSKTKHLILQNVTLQRPVFPIQMHIENKYIYC